MAVGSTTSSSIVEPRLIPQDLKEYSVNAHSPWQMGREVFHRVSSEPAANFFRKVELLPTDPDARLVMRYFFESPPPGMGIHKIWAIHNPNQTAAFEVKIKQVQQESKNPFFLPKWKNHDKGSLSHREEIIKRWRSLSQSFSEITVPHPTGKRGGDVCPNIGVLPLWHGTDAVKCNSICSSGFTFLGKHLGGAGSTDFGFFGSGIYFTDSAQYAAMYGSGQMILSWVTMREPFPVLSDKPHSATGCDMQLLSGQEHFENYNAHFIPVVSAKPGDPHCMNYYPTVPGQPPVWDEFVVFESAQTLPRFIVEYASIGLNQRFPPKLIMSPAAEKVKVEAERGDSIAQFNLGCRYAD